MSWIKPVRVEEDGRWYHDNNVSGLMLLCLSVGFLLGWLGRIYYQFLVGL